MLSLIRDKVDQYLLAERLKRDPYVVKKARLLAWIHVIALASGLFMLIPSFWVRPEMILPMVSFLLITVGLVWIFVRRGDMVLSGNLLVGLVSIVLLSGMLETGGLYSDNLLWMVLVPIVAFLFTSRRWGMIWSVTVLSLLTALFVLELDADVSYRYRSFNLGPDYYFVSYLGLFAGLFGIILLFVRGNDDILMSLRQKSAALRAQKRHAESQNEKLRTQERELTQSNRDLELFAYVASHDLKEPLRMVNAYTEVLQRKLGPTLSLKDQEYMGYVREGAQRMQVMLDDLLAYSKLGKERGEESAVDLNRTLTMVNENLKVRLEESGGEILWEELPTLRGKSTHYLQVFQNLIANSLKFHREGVPPRVRLTTRHDKKAETYIIAVEDNGIGMREQDLDSIFGVFQRLHRSDKFEGSGIGLATVQRIIERLGGKIVVTSVLGEGSTFQIHLPEQVLVRSSKRAMAH